ncbi:MAG: bifunctional 2-C-methyl-D-erythritol 4-phosphate cytidylyltransferase/2-C-methyl-D-erythritol 2,4-cyclodiphosphate synthase [Alphaproteobacteria bacterium]|nr:bifunctional 2-C-methyl-D-erythritol 4-phosphate cytidylyltransferase/2-C-methyl-D-erythritol 2,4-cyclodiphosphate synthase [Alphaproteobacteria bacterium]
MKEDVASRQGHAGDKSASVAVLVVAAGKGLRAGGALPKQYQRLNGRAVLSHALDAFLRHGGAASVQAVISDGDTPLYEEACAELGGVGPAIHGGAERQESVLLGLEALAAASTAERPDFVLIHDGARPFVSTALIDRVIDALKSGAAGVVPGLAVTDTVKRLGLNGLVAETLDRRALRRVQTPQGFPFDAILAAHRACAGAALTDDAAVAAEAGLAVQVVEGEEANMKITHPEDFLSGVAAEPRRLETPRVGQGFDVHRFEPGDAVTLCGVHIPHPARLKGHSDADVGLHALTDAILGALGAGDIGDHFPPSDPRWKGADSADFLRHAASLASDRGARIAHLDVILICEQPKIGPHKAAMRARIAEILAISPDAVSVKATTTEKLGFTGRGEGVAAQAVATLLFPV